MAATDYVIVTGWMNAYLTKKKKPTKKGPQIMSEDRRPITEGEMIGLFEFYLRKWCEEHNEKTLFISKDDKVIFKATLIDQSKEEYKKNQKKEQNEFYNGMWCCVQDLVAIYDEPTIAKDILRGYGISIEQMRKAQESSGSYDEKMNQFINDFEQSTNYETEIQR